MKSTRTEKREQIRGLPRLPPVLCSPFSPAGVPDSILFPKSVDGIEIVKDGKLIAPATVAQH
jgi:hypothetical protein